MRNRVLQVLVMAGALLAFGCGKPGADDLRNSFAQQLASSRFVHDFQRSADDLRFTGPGAEGEDAAAWRVHIDSAVIENTDDPTKPYRGVVKSSWYAGNRLVSPRGRDSNLPLGLTATGLAQDCWAVWNKATAKWDWE